mgnify:CR=1 FL=1
MKKIFKITKNKIKKLIPIRIKLVLFKLFFRYLHFDEVKLIFFYFKKNTKGLMIDVGAHRGSSSEFFVLEKWNVHCFEPDKKNFNFLLNKFNNSKNVRLNNLAISNKEGVLNFYQSEVSDGISSLIKFHESHKIAYKTKVIKLATYIKKNKIKNIDFLKIDVEGNDFNVLRSINFEEVMPRIILLEYEDKKTKKIKVTTNDILEFLTKHNYYYVISEWFPITQYGSDHIWKKLHPINSSKFDINGWGNIIAFKNIQDADNFYAYAKKTINKIK